LSIGAPSAHDAAMLKYLNNDTNVKGRANENLAREIMELFGMGRDQGYTETDMVGAAVANIVAKTGNTESEARAALVARNPQGRMVRPEEVAAAVLWLCLPASSSVTGQAIAVAGGEVMG
jgi:uncharacterized protein (DUF1800 family)